jgi:hypothetical protein
MHGFTEVSRLFKACFLAGNRPVRVSLNVHAAAFERGSRGRHSVRLYVQGKVK